MIILKSELTFQPKEFDDGFVCNCTQLLSDFHSVLSYIYNIILNDSFDEDLKSYGFIFSMYLVICHELP